MHHFAAAPGQPGVHERICRQLRTLSMTLGGAPGWLLDGEVACLALELTATRRLRR